MRRGGLPVEETGCGEDERACADRTESRSARVRILESSNQQSRRWHSRPPAGNDDGVRPVEEAQRGPRRRAHAEIVPRHVNAEGRIGVSQQILTGPLLFIVPKLKQH